MPVNELVRLVRVYSTPWEEKSAALKKLHEDYENKQRQLNIAVKRLQLVDAHVRCVCFKNYIKIYFRIKKLQYINYIYMYVQFIFYFLSVVLIIHSLKIFFCLCITNHLLLLLMFSPRE